MKGRMALLALVPVLSVCGCGDKTATAAYHLRQSIMIGDHKVEVWEDARITPALRERIWGGAKDPAVWLAEASPELRRSFAEAGVRHAHLHLVNAGGHVTADRALDCELAEVTEPLPQGEGVAWAVGNDCSEPDANYAGMITRFFTLDGDEIRWQAYADRRDGERQGLTLVAARRIQWRTQPKGHLDEIREVSSHPDFDDPRAAADPTAAPTVVEYLDYRWSPADQIWLRSVRVDRPASWDESQPFPPALAFPG